MNTMRTTQLTTQRTAALRPGSIVMGDGVLLAYPPGGGAPARIAPLRQDIAEYIACGVIPTEVLRTKKRAAPPRASSFTELQQNVLVGFVGQALGPLQQRVKELEAEARKHRMHPATRAALERAQASIELAEAVLA